MTTDFIGLDNSAVPKALLINSCFITAAKSNIQRSKVIKSVFVLNFNKQIYYLIRVCTMFELVTKFFFWHENSIELCTGTTNASLGPLRNNLVFNRYYSGFSTMQNISSAFRLINLSSAFDLRCCVYNTFFTCIYFLLHVKSTG